MEISASNKLKEFLGKQKTTYSERKKKSIEITRNLLIENNNTAQWFLFGGSDVMMDEMIMQQWSE